MQALRMTGPGAVRLEEIDEADAGPGEVRVRVRLVGLCGSDLNSFRGRNPMVVYPRVPGHEVAATLVEPVAGDPKLSAGTAVAVLPYTNCGHCPSCRRGRPNACEYNQTLGVQRDGALRAYLSVAPEKLYPANLSLKALCLVEPLTVGCHAVSRGRVAPEDAVAVIGCGGVGLGAIAASAFRGATTIAIDVDQHKLDVAQKAGAQHLINSRDVNLHDALLAVTDGRGPDVIIEAVGNPVTFRMAVEEVAYTGRVVYIGYAKEPVAYETRLFVQKELDILGSRNALPEDFAEVIRMLEAGRFPVEETISAIVPLAEAAEVLKAWSDAPERYTKILISLEAADA